MSSTRYIELTSGHRNRQNWPCPAEFTVPIACINRGDTPRKALDKVLASYPEYAWYQLPYALPGDDEGPDSPRAINGIYYTSLWPLAVDPDNLSEYRAGRLAAMKFSGGTAAAPVLTSALVNPPNAWTATSPPTPNPVLNPYFTTTSDYFAGALLIKFKEDPSAALNNPPYEWNGTCESTVIASYDATTGTAFLYTSFSDDFDAGDFFLIDFDTDPNNKWKDFVRGGPRVFIPSGSTGKNAYAGLYIQNYTWTRNGLDNNQTSGFAKIVKYDATRRVAYLDKAIPLVDQLACVENSVPECFYGSNTFTMRDSVPNTCKSYNRTGISQGSIGEMQFENPGRYYKIGETIASGKDANEYFDRYYEAPGVRMRYPVPDYILIGSGTGFRGFVETVDGSGGIISIVIEQQGQGYDVRDSLQLLVYKGTWDNNQVIDGVRREKGTGDGCIMTLPQVYQSLELYSRWPGDTHAMLRTGDFVFLPAIGQVDANGYPNYGTKDTPPAMPRYAYLPGTSDQQCPETSFRHLDIRNNGYPARIECLPNPGERTFPFSGAVQIAKSFDKAVTFNSMWATAIEYPEETAEGPVTVLLLDGSYNVSSAGRTDWGTDVYAPDATLGSSGYLREQDLEILKFSHDNEHSLNYTGSTVSQNEMVCYAIQLISLTLPNIPLRNEIGGLISFYPYVYVELSNVTAPSSGSKGVIYSNNPNSNNALFRVNISDINEPRRSRFIKLSGDGAVQTVKFKPNDNLHFRVYLQDGTLFQTELQDFAPPLHPDFFVQVGACFAITRLV